MFSFPTGSLHAYLLLLRELKLYNAPFHDLLPQLKLSNPHLYYLYLSHFQNATSPSNLMMPLEKPSSDFLEVTRSIPHLAWSLPRRAPPLVHEHMENSQLKSEGGSVSETKNEEAIPSMAEILSQPPPPPTKSDSLPTISVTRRGPRRMCDFPWLNEEVINSESEYVLADEVTTRGTMSEESGDEWVAEEEEEEEGAGEEVEEKVEEIESRGRDLRGTFEIKRMSVDRLEYGMQPEKPDSIESALSPFLLNCSCESVEEDEPTSNSPHLSIVDSEGTMVCFVFNCLRMSDRSETLYEISYEWLFRFPQLDAVCATSSPSARRRLFKRLCTRLRRLFLCWRTTEDD
ncbi:unnamed protein product [Rodentolepis nana]|uniref:Uncharacterized protein n=1 Tax=Rodentolepis nana TaxID=102285 RepID=A0A0R3T2R7_RODNA|nr:unnamed protein product [Rodentolepis nana]